MIPDAAAVETVAKLLALIERLAPEHPLVDTSETDGSSWCGWCDAAVVYRDTAGQRTYVQHIDHADDCPWVEARKLLDREVPA